LSFVVFYCVVFMAHPKGQCVVVVHDLACFEAAHLAQWSLSRPCFCDLGLQGCGKPHHLHSACCTAANGVWGGGGSVRRRQVTPVTLHWEPSGNSSVSQHPAFWYKLLALVLWLACRTAKNASFDMLHTLDSQASLRECGLHIVEGPTRETDFVAVH
jgi:hypothetical protein